MSARRSGYAIPELLAALALTAVICGGMAGALAAAQRVVRSQARRVAFAEAVRVASSLLAGELRYLDPVADVYAWAEDSVALRVFRGAAVVCGGSGGGAVLVRYRGLRDPDPAKDSVVVVRAGGDAPPLKLEASAASPSGCLGEDERTGFRWTLETSPPPGTLLLLFESGSYRLSDHALRYGRGRAGRQPLTAEVFDASAGGFRAPGAAGGPVPAVPPAIELHLVAGSAPGTGGGAQPAAAVRLRIAFLNEGRAADGARSP